MDHNPYNPPQDVDAVVPSRWRTVSTTCLSIAVVTTLIGFFSLFFPNSPPGGWFLLGLLFFLAAAFVGDRRIRIASLVGLVMVFLLLGTTFLLYKERQEQQLRIQKAQEMRRSAIRP